jgi:hypothetical protein
METYRITGDPEKQFSLTFDNTKDAFLVLKVPEGSNKGYCAINSNGNGAVADMLFLYMMYMAAVPAEIMYNLVFVMYQLTDDNLLLKYTTDKDWKPLEESLHNLLRKSSEIYKATGVYPSCFNLPEFVVFYKHFKKAYKYFYKVNFDTVVKICRRDKLVWNDLVFADFLLPNEPTVIDLDRTKDKFVVLYHGNEEKSPFEFYQKGEFREVTPALVNAMRSTDNPYMSFAIIFALNAALSRIHVLPKFLRNKSNVVYFINNTYGVRVAASIGKLKLYLLANPYFKKHKLLGSSVFFVGSYIFYVLHIFTWRIIKLKKQSQE